MTYGTTYSWGVSPAKQFLAIGETEIYGGNSDCPNDENWSLVISCAPQKSRDSISLLHGAEKVLPNVKPDAPSPTLVIPWPDGSAPALSKDFWTGLVQDLLDVKGKVLVHCMAGHGRTGTALACIAGTINDLGYSLTPTMECAIQYVRNHYDKDAIESSAQVRYIRAMGFPVSDTIKGSDDYRNVGYHGQRSLGSYTKIKNSKTSHPNPKTAPAAPVSDYKLPGWDTVKDGSSPVDDYLDGLDRDLQEGRLSLSEYDNALDAHIYGDDSPDESKTAGFINWSKRFLP